MSEGPEVKHTADKIAGEILGRIYCRCSGQNYRTRTKPKRKNNWIKSLIRRYLWQKYHYPFFKWCIFA